MDLFYLLYRYYRRIYATDACSGPCTCLSILPYARFQPAVDLHWRAIEVTTTTTTPLPSLPKDNIHILKYVYVLHVIMKYVGLHRVTQKRDGNVR